MWAVLFVSCSKFAFAHPPAQPADPEKGREPHRALHGWPARRGKGGTGKYSNSIPPPGNPSSVLLPEQHLLWDLKSEGCPSLPSGAEAGVRKEWKVGKEGDTWVWYSRSLTAFIALFLLLRQINTSFPKFPPLLHSPRLETVREQRKSESQDRRCRFALE